MNERGTWIVEIAARSIGGRCSRILRFGLDSTLEELILRHLLGLQGTRIFRENRAAGVMMIPIPGAGILRAVHGVEEVRKLPLIEDLEITAPLDQALVPLPEGASYLGFIFAKGPIQRPWSRRSVWRTPSCGSTSRSSSRSPGSDELGVGAGLAGSRIRHAVGVPFAPLAAARVAHTGPQIPLRVESRPTALFAEQLAVGSHPGLPILDTAHRRVSDASGRERRERNASQEKWHGRPGFNQGPERRSWGQQRTRLEA